MPKTTTIDHSVLEMALVGYEWQRNRIEAAIAEIQAELGQDGPSRSISTATASAEPKATGKKRFSAAARKRMAAAQKKRWPGEGGEEGRPEGREARSQAEDEDGGTEAEGRRCRGSESRRGDIRRPGTSRYGTDTSHGVDLVGPCN